MYKPANYWKNYLVEVRGHKPLNHSSWINNANESASGMVSADDPRQFDYSRRPMEKSRNRGVEVPEGGWIKMAMEQRERIVGYRPEIEADMIGEGFAALFAGLAIEGNRHESTKMVLMPVKVIENALVPRTKTAFISR